MEAGLVPSAQVVVAWFPSNSSLPSLQGGLTLISPLGELQLPLLSLVAPAVDDDGNHMGIYANTLVLSVLSHMLVMTNTWVM